MIFSNSLVSSSLTFSCWLSSSRVSIFLVVVVIGSTLRSIFLSLSCIGLLAFLSFRLLTRLCLSLRLLLISCSFCFWLWFVWGRFYIWLSLTIIFSRSSSIFLVLISWLNFLLFHLRFPFLFNIFLFFIIIIFHFRCRDFFFSLNLDNLDFLFMLWLFNLLFLLSWYFYILFFWLNC